MMLFSIPLFIALLGSVEAFTSRSITTVTFLAPASTTRLGASSPMPYDDDKMIFYTLGTNLAFQIGDMDIRSLLEKEELDVCLEGFRDNLLGTALQDPRTILEKYGPQLNAILRERAERTVQRIKKECSEFIANFLKSNPEATTTESGLVYLETKAGTGESPTIDSTVEVHYHGTLPDGTVVDSSVDRGQAVEFPLRNVIKGWTEGLQLMKEGGKATLMVPSDLAYGDVGNEVVPGGSTLKFDVELFKVVNNESLPRQPSTGGGENKVTFPDGTTLTLPEGVKARLVSDEE